MESVYKNAMIYGGIVWPNPVNEWGAPYINQWLPVRRARWWECIAAMLGYAPLL